MKKILPLAISLILILSASIKTNAHCEIPCGIYDDSLRVELIKEHIQTIEKSMKMINKLNDLDEKDFHMIARWTINKEEHANKIQEIVSQYFMHQRIKPVDPKDKVAYAKYVYELSLLHQLQVYAMKSKQTTDYQYLGKMLESIEAFEDSYFGHTHEHDGHSHSHKNDHPHTH